MDDEVPGTVDVDDEDDEVAPGSVVDVLDELDELDDDELDVVEELDVDDDELLVLDGGTLLEVVDSGTVVVVESGGSVVETPAGTVDVVDSGVVVVADVVVLVELDGTVVLVVDVVELVDGPDPGNTGGAAGGRNASVEYVGGMERSVVVGRGTDVIATTVVVESTHDERGTSISGNWVSVPSLLPPVTRARVTIPARIRNAPTDAAARFAWRLHQGAGTGS